MAKLKFGAWIATYAWADGGTGPENMRRIHEAIRKCEEHGIDVWVIDHRCRRGDCTATRGSSRSTCCRTLRPSPPR